MTLERTVRTIPANPFLTQERKRKQQSLRVAAYCRVSTEEEEQQSSFENQVAYYTEKIKNHEGWDLAGIFADEGISGVHAKKRTHFLEMIELCKKKKIDLILTKSISRFARNTLDCIQYVRMLKALDIAVVFEKEGINTKTMSTELLLTCLGAFAQAESESISSNVAWGKRKGYKNGKFSMCYKHFLGYEKGPDGRPRIVPEEAEIIRFIYNRYLDGDSLDAIRVKLEKRHVLTPTGKEKWNREVIQRILQNEKYMGDVLLQKTYTADFLSGTIRKNNGELPKYYITNNHEGIISREDFHRVQEEIARRKSKSPTAQKKVKTNRGRYSSQYALSERLVCGNCGCAYRRVTWSKKGKKKIVWRCTNRLEFGTKYCKDSPTILEANLQEAIMGVLHSMVQNDRDSIAENLRQTLLSIETGGKEGPDPIAIEKQMEEKREEFRRLTKMVSDDNFNDCEFYDFKIKQVNDEILRLREQKKEAERAIEAQQYAGERLKGVLDIITGESLDVKEYSDQLVRRIIEKVTVLTSDKISIRFIGGYEITAEMNPEL